jgi:hypothetical protein
LIGRRAARGSCGHAASLSSSVAGAGQPDGPAALARAPAARLKTGRRRGADCVCARPGRQYRTLAAPARASLSAISGPGAPGGAHKRRPTQSIRSTINCITTIMMPQQTINCARRPAGRAGQHLSQRRTLIMKLSRRRVTIIVVVAAAGGGGCLRAAAACEPPLEALLGPGGSLQMCTSRVRARRRQRSFSRSSALPLGTLTRRS